MVAETNVEFFKPSIAGKPPIPRSKHCAAFVMDKYILIYGGYNTEYSENGFVNDIILLNLHVFQWEPLAIFGYHPQERYWCSCGIDGSRIFILGGQPEKVFTDPALHVLELDPVKVQDELQTRKRLLLLPH